MNNQEEKSIPNFGPIASNKNISIFNSISNRSLLYCSAIINQKGSKMSSEELIIASIMALSTQTSFSIQLLNSWNYHITALALSRIRIEQLIISSYLIHENRKNGFERYLNFIPIEDWNNALTLMRNKNISGNFEKVANFEEIENRGINAVKKINKGFVFGKDKVPQKWTSLSLKDMAIRRDKIVNQKEKKIISESLELAFIALYKDFSSIIHSDGMAISDGFLGVPIKNEEGDLIFVSEPWYDLIATCVSKFDLLQSYELFSFFGENQDNAFIDLLNKWSDAKSDVIKSLNIKK